MNFKNKFLDECINHIPFDGWNDKSIDLSLSNLKIKKEIFLENFPKGTEDVIKFYLEDSDNKMVREFKKIKNVSTSMTKKIKSLILIKLNQSKNNKDVIRKTIFWLGLPQNSNLAFRTLYETVDLIWRTAGDTSTDSSFYSKRILLSGVYSSTLLAFLGDDANDMIKTEKFLDRRLDNVLKIPKLINPFKNTVSEILKFSKSFSKFNMKE